MVGTVIVHALVLTVVGALAHLALGNVRLALAGWLLVGSVPGVVLGSRMSVRVPETALRVVLASLLIGIGIRFGLLAAGDGAAAALPVPAAAELASDGVAPAGARP